MMTKISMVLIKLLMRFSFDLSHNLRPKSILIYFLENNGFILFRFYSTKLSTASYKYKSVNF